MGTVIYLHLDCNSCIEFKAMQIHLELRFSTVEIFFIKDLLFKLYYNKKPIIFETLSILKTSIFGSDTYVVMSVLC